MKQAKRRTKILRNSSIKHSTLGAWLVQESPKMAVFRHGRKFVDVG